MKDPAPVPTIGIERILDALRRVSIPDVDAVVGVERGGIVPAAIIAALHDKPLASMRLAYRDDDHNPIHPEPQLLTAPALPCAPPAHLLLVDDVRVTGSTLERAAGELTGYRITTLTLLGDADLVVFPTTSGCVTWPWSPEPALDAPAP